MASKRSFPHRFGKSDVHDLLSLLAEGEKNDAIKLPKLSSLFASKACRRSPV